MPLSIFFHQKGDILIYTNSELGHVAIYESDNSTYHQNWSNQLYVTNYDGYYTYKSYWGCIHPNFNGVSATSQVGITDSSSGQQQTSQTSSAASQDSGMNIAEMISLFIKLAMLCIKGVNMIVRIIRTFA